MIEGCGEDEARLEKQRAWEEMPLEEHMQLYIGKGLDRKEAMKAVAKDRGVPRREIYDRLIGKS